MVCAVIVAKIIGCTLPIIAKMIKLDPALMAGPMITTIVDMVTLLIYFALASRSLASLNQLIKHCGAAIESLIVIVE